jgi:hypothetical protein
MVLTLEQLGKILASGGSLKLAASSYSVSQLAALASAAAAGRASLELNELSALTAAQLTKLAQLAPGLILFDLQPQPQGASSGTGA